MQRIAIYNVYYCQQITVRFSALGQCGIFKVYIDLYRPDIRHTIQANLMQGGLGQPTADRRI